MNRDELIETADLVRIFGDAWHATPEGAPGDRRRAGLRAVIDAIEPLIREDEKAKADLAISFWAKENESLKNRLADADAEIAALKMRLKDTQRQAERLTEQRVNLRAAVEALTHDGLTPAQSQRVLKRHVLALIDGGDDG